MQIHHLLRSAALLTAFSLQAFIPFSRAQAVKPVTDVPATSGTVPVVTSSTVAPARDDIVQMSAFQVSTKRTNDYIASETLTGTRLAMKVSELPFQVNIVTSEFMSDFAAFDTSEQLAYVSNYSPSEPEGVTTDSMGKPVGTNLIRGFPSIPYVDGFRRVNGAMPAGVDIDTVTVVKGPNASIYGQTVPGGVANRTIVHPTEKGETKASLTAGSNSTLRANAYTNQPLGNSGKLFYRVAVENDQRSYDQPYASQHKTYVSGQFLWKINDSTQWITRVSYDLDHNHDQQSVYLVRNMGSNTIFSGTTEMYYLYGIPDPTTGVMQISGSATAPQLNSVDPYRNPQGVIDQYTQWVNGGMPDGFILNSGSSIYHGSNFNKYMGVDYDASRNINVQGPLGETYTRWTEVNTQLIKRWNSWFDTKAAFDYFDDMYHKQSITGGSSVYFITPGAGNNGQYAVVNPDGTTKPAGVYNTTDYRYVNGTIGSINSPLKPQWTYSPFHNTAIQIDNSFKFKTGPVEHQLLITLDFNQYNQTTFQTQYQGTGTYTTTQSTPYPITFTGQYSKDLPVGIVPLGVPLTAADLWYPTYSQYPELYAGPMDWKNNNNNYTQMTRDYGIFISERATMFNGRLHAYAGLRFDRLQNQIVDWKYLSTPVGEPFATPDIPLNVQWNTTAWKPQGGLNFEPIKNLIIFGNISTAYQPNPQYKTSQNSDGQYSAQVFPNETSWGWEYGARYSAFNQRLNATLSYWYIDRSNVIIRSIDDLGNVGYAASGEQDAHGVDFDVNWVLTDSFQIMAIYGYNGAEFVKAGSPYLIGMPTPGAVRDNYAFNVRYSFHNGPLNGLSIGGGIRYYTKSLFGVSNGQTLSGAIWNNRMPNGQLPFPNLPEGDYIPSPTGSSNTQITLVSDGRDAIYNSPYAITDLWIKYTFRTSIYGHRLGHSIQLNLKNAFNKFYAYGSGYIGDGRQILINYNINF